MSSRKECAEGAARIFLEPRKVAEVGQPCHPCAGGMCQQAHPSGPWHDGRGCYIHLGGWSNPQTSNSIDMRHEIF